MVRRILKYALLPVAVVVLSCVKESDREGREVTLRVSTPMSVVTKDVTPVDVIPSSLYWGASTGSSGAETSVWACASGAVVEGEIATGHYQDAIPVSYNYYVCNQSFVIGAASTPVVTSGTVDVIAGSVRGDNTSTPLVALRHIYSRTGTFTMSTQLGYTISNVYWTIEGKSAINGTAGTYNLSTMSWTATSATLPETTVTSESDLWIIPGEYVVSCHYTLTRGDYVKSFVKSGDVTFIEGKVTNISGVASGADGEDISFTVYITPWGAENIDNLVIVAPVTGEPFEITSSAATLWRTKTATYTASTAVTWESSDPSVATVEPTTGEITAVGPGEADIIATSGIYVESQKVYVNQVTGVTMSSTALNNNAHQVNSSISGTAVINGGGTVYGTPGTINVDYVSSNSTAANVVNTSLASGVNNTIQYYTPGSAVITASVSASEYGDGVSGTCTVTLTPWLTVMTPGDKEVYLWTFDNNYYYSTLFDNINIRAWGGTPMITNSNSSLFVTSLNFSYAYPSYTAFDYNVKPVAANYAGTYSLNVSLGSSSETINVYVNRLSNSLFYDTSFSDAHVVEWYGEQDFGCSMNAKVMALEEPVNHGTRSGVSFTFNALANGYSGVYSIVSSQWFRSYGPYWVVDCSNSNPIWSSVDIDISPYSEGDSVDFQLEYSRYGSMSGTPQYYSYSFSGSEITYSSD